MGRGSWPCWDWVTVSQALAAEKATSQGPAATWLGAGEPRGAESDQQGAGPQP